jgi:hypothetical protein
MDSSGLTGRQKAVIDHLERDHRDLENAKSKMAANKYYDVVVKMCEETLQNTINRAAEADVPAHFIASAMEYKPVAKMKEEIKALQERESTLRTELECVRRQASVWEDALEISTKQVIDLRAEVNRVNKACGEIDADWEASHRRLELCALGGALITFVLGITFGMMF